MHCKEKRVERPPHILLQQSLLSAAHRNLTHRKFCASWLHFFYFTSYIFLLCRVTTAMASVQPMVAPRDRQCHMPTCTALELTCRLSSCVVITRSIGKQCSAALTIGHHVG